MYHHQLTLFSKRTCTKSGLTFKANINNGRYGWLRLTPAYSVHLVQERISHLPLGSRIIEPFSGSGTTALAAMSLGMDVYARDINPFLVWFAYAKTRCYEDSQCSHTVSCSQEICSYALDNKNAEELWEPSLFNIDRWWCTSILSALKVLRSKIDTESGITRDLLDIAFCRTMIASSNVSFGHQSMSFKNDNKQVGTDEQIYRSVVRQFSDDVKYICYSAKDNPEGRCVIDNTDSRKPFPAEFQADYLITSPPYANRISYIRELRPYMYWLRYIQSPEQAGELDWQAIGGTWGSASTKIKTWQATEDSCTPIDDKIKPIIGKILKGKSGDILAPYVHKYFSDIWAHLHAVIPAVKTGGELCYIVGNSVFSNNVVPTHEWYAQMMKCIGLRDINIDVIRKRNSNKRLFEYAVTARK